VERKDAPEIGRFCDLSKSSRLAPDNEGFDPRDVPSALGESARVLVDGLSATLSDIRAPRDVGAGPLIRRPLEADGGSIRLPNLAGGSLNPIARGPRGGACRGCLEDSASLGRSGCV
jgi:hypothetical protein